MDEYGKTLKEMKELYETIQSLPSQRLARRQVLVARRPIPFKDPKQDQIIAELARTQETVNMLNRDRITFQEQIIWDDELINNIKNTSDRIYRELDWVKNKLAEEQRYL